MTEKNIKLTWGSIWATIMPSRCTLWMTWHKIGPPVWSLDKVKETRLLLSPPQGWMWMFQTLSPRPRERCKRERLILSGYLLHGTPPGRRLGAATG